MQETYKYKELDDELEEELQAEMCALALAGKAPPDGIEIKVILLSLIHLSLSSFTDFFFSLRYWREFKR